ncbi:MAG: hypothetical protein HC809_06750, partial [Gammaproteobacteria bacterium]|nr:hypothetical protein [Gammaproteobacteria bacterium]
MAPWLAVLLVVTLSINLLSAYIRHYEAGLGCVDVPACYGHVGDIAAQPSAVAAASDALTPTAAAKRAHRAIATVLVVLVLIVTVKGRAQANTVGVATHIPYLMIGVVLVLAV